MKLFSSGVKIKDPDNSLNLSKYLKKNEFLDIFMIISRKPGGDYYQTQLLMSRKQYATFEFYKIIPKIVLYYLRMKNCTFQ